MQRKIKIILAVLAIIILVLAVYIYIVNSSQEKTVLPSDQNEALNQPLFPIPDKNEENFTIKTSSGDVVIENVYKNYLYDLSGNGVAFKDNDEYYIAYYPEDQGFIITIMNSNIQKARDNAENDFINTLGINKEQACKLKVFLGVPISVSEKAAGENYGLSFCQNGISFPK